MSTPKQILVIDLEATCWKSPHEAWNQEVLEIGITPIELKSRMLQESESIIVIPTTGDISDYCIELTGITDDVVLQRGISFRESMKLLNDEYSVGKNMWASWGKFDDKLIANQCLREQVGYPFSPLHLNVKALFVAKFGFSCSIKKAAEFLEIPFEGRWHSGKDDSRNTARILLQLI